MRYLLSCFASLILPLAAYAALNQDSKDNLVIISPHRKSVQQEFIPKFKEYYKKNFHREITIEWLDQGGASDDLRFILSRFEKTPASAGVDLFWGGGEHPHYELDKKKLLLPYPLNAQLKKEIRSDLAGVLLYNKEETWHATAISSFGIFYNKPLFKMLKLAEPQSWEDLANPKLFGNLSNADPRRSSSNVTMNLVILQALGWEKGWELLTAIAANTRSYTHSSSDPIKAVVAGDAAAGMTIGYFANAKIGELGPQRLGFALPTGKTIINPDPIAILKGAPNRLAAERFIDYILSSQAQKLLLLSTKYADGPKHSILGRMAINEQAYAETNGRRVYELNPFDLGSFSPMKLDVETVTGLQFIFTDLLGATHIDTHKELKEAWQAMLKRGLRPAEVAALAKPPLTQKEMVELAGKWNDNGLRNRTINGWLTYAKSKYLKLAKAGI